MRIEKTLNPQHELIDYLTKQINDEFSQYGRASPFGFFVKDSEGEIIAGCNGFILYGAVYTDQLWVDKPYRHQGLAKRLMNQVHELGRERKCQIATVSTISFQGAMDFYKRLGYELDFEQAGYVSNSKALFLKKNLVLE